MVDKDNQKTYDETPSLVEEGDKNQGNQGEEVPTPVIPIDDGTGTTEVNDEDETPTSPANADEKEQGEQPEETSNPKTSNSDSSQTTGTTSESFFDIFKFVKSENEWPGKECIQLECKGIAEIILCPTNIIKKYLLDGSTFVDAFKNISKEDEGQVWYGTVYYEKDEKTGETKEIGTVNICLELGKEYNWVAYENDEQTKEKGNGTVTINNIMATGYVVSDGGQEKEVYYGSEKVSSEQALEELKNNL